MDLLLFLFVRITADLWVLVLNLIQAGEASLED